MKLFGPPNIDKLTAKGDVKGLIKALDYRKSDSKSDPVRRRAASAFGQIEAQVKDVALRSRMIEALIAALQDENYFVRNAAVCTLGQIGGPRAIDGLSSALKDKYWEVRITAAEALGQIGGTETVAALSAALKGGFPRDAVADAVANALEKVGWIPGKDEISALYWVVKKEWDKCVDIGAPAVAPLIAALEARNSSVRKSAADALGKICVQVDSAPIQANIIKSLVVTFTGKNRDARKEAADALIKIGTLAGEQLIATLKHDDSQVRELAAVVLGQIGGPGAVEALINSLDDRSVFTAVAGALGQIGDPRAIEPLMTALLDDARNVRKVAAEALYKIGWRPGQDENGAAFWIVRREFDRCEAIGAPAVKPLITSLKDDDTRQGAVGTLIRIGIPGIELLIPALQNQTGNVRWAVANVLDKLGWRPAKDQIGASYWIAKREWNKCVELGAAAVPPLIAVLRDESLSVRKAAFDALGQIGDPIAVEPLIAAIMDGEWPARKAAAEALVSLYKSDLLDNTDKSLILAQRGNITAAHDDRTKRINNEHYSDCGNHKDFAQHTDNGMGVSFPV